MKINNVYYKVVAQMNPKFVSALFDFLPDSLLLEYELYKITLPLVGRIFVFKELENAKLFKNYREDWTILKGFAAEPRKIKLVCSLYDQKKFLSKFWKESKHNHITSKYAPRGSYSCSSFLPIEIVI